MIEDTKPYLRFPAHKDLFAGHRYEARNAEKDFCHWKHADQEGEKRNEKHP